MTIGFERNGALPLAHTNQDQGDSEIYERGGSGESQSNSQAFDRLGIKQTLDAGDDDGDRGETDQAAFSPA